MRKNMEYEVVLRTGDKSLLNEIKELWEELNQLHKEKSLDFKSHYRTFTFQAREQSLLSTAEKGKLFVIVAYFNEIKVGYCVSSVVSDTGEIDSIYVKPDYQKRHIGHLLIEAALNWISENCVKTINIAVSVGNEEVFGFYAKYGFKPRATIL
jgi:ribosomal protein S18 acetylase RimI-like enzyme